MLYKTAAPVASVTSSTIITKTTASNTISTTYISSTTNATAITQADANVIVLRLILRRRMSCLK